MTTQTWTATGRLFQARMWREYAQAWDGRSGWLARDWVERIGKVSRVECLRRARVNVYLARRLLRSPSPQSAERG